LTMSIAIMRIASVSVGKCLGGETTDRYDCQPPLIFVVAHDAPVVRYFGEPPGRGRIGGWQLPKDPLKLFTFNVVLTLLSRMIVFATVATKCNLSILRLNHNVLFGLGRGRARAATLNERRSIEVQRELAGQQSIRRGSVRALLALGTMLCIGLAGGCKARAHSVTLTWQAPRATVGNTIVGYNVYRSTTSGGPFVKLASRVPDPRYEDHLLNNGRAYYYVVTAVDQAGRESRFSNETRAVIP